MNDALQSTLTIVGGFILAWTILSFVQPRVSNFSEKSCALKPMDFDDGSASNLALVGVGLATAIPRPSVMDSTPSPSMPVIMQEPMAASPEPVSMQPLVITTQAPPVASPSVSMPTAPVITGTIVASPVPVVQAPAPFMAPSPSS